MSTHPFAGARKARPTVNHRPAIWEAMLATVHAMNAAGEVRYFDYDWDAARAFAGVDAPDADARVARVPRTDRVSYTGDEGSEPRPGAYALWVRR